MTGFTNSIEQFVLQPVPLDQRPVAEAGFGTRLASWLGIRGSLNRRFEIVQVLGRGRTAQVYLVRDRRSNVLQALKVYLPGMPSETALEDKSRPNEGEIAAALCHPRILKAHEHGTTDTGQYYVLTDYALGNTLDKVIRLGAYAGDRLALVRQAADAVAAMHEAGFLHCDLCPENFLYSHDGEHLTLFDFETAIPAAREFSKTILRVIRGNYLPPELLRCQTLNRGTDLFQLGVTAYELIAGRLPWEEESGSSSVARLLRRADDIRMHAPTIDPVLANAIHRLLHTDPAKRFPSARDFLAAIADVGMHVLDDLQVDSNAPTVVAKSETHDNPRVYVRRPMPAMRSIRA